ncbi:hypothetical protein [Carnobacterium maltaromaticum]|uniref:hypothetical protein n=1 Tax=Carnobacterium maltaromaticum TaxID=2751 RepID=UPI0015E06D87|nr:hypothetical protein [Carnobacterium maltaromaticum]
MDILTPQQLQNILAYLSLEYGNLTINEIAKLAESDGIGWSYKKRPTEDCSPS